MEDDGESTAPSHAFNPVDAAARSSKDSTLTATPELATGSSSTSSSQRPLSGTSAPCNISDTTRAATLRKHHTRQVLVNEADLPPYVRFWYPKEVDPKEVSFSIHADDICIRWDWPDPSRLDYQATKRVKQEVSFIEQATTLNSARDSFAQKIQKLEQQRQVAKARHDGRGEMKLQQKKQELEKNLKQTEANMGILQQKYDKSYQSGASERLEQINIWEQRPLTKRARKARVAEYDEAEMEAVQESMRQPTSLISASVSTKTARKARSNRAPTARGKDVVSRATPAAEDTISPSPPISIAPKSHTRKRKNPIVDRYSFDEDSDDDSKSEDFDKLLKAHDKKIRRTSDTGPKAAPRQMGKSKTQLFDQFLASTVARAVTDEEKGRANMMAEKARKEAEEMQKKLRKEIFAEDGGMGSKENGDEESTPVDSGYASSPAV